MQHRNPTLSKLVSYTELRKSLPTSGNHINATFSIKPEEVAECIKNAAPTISDATKQLAKDSGIIVVYQAFNAQIASHAVAKQTFLGCDVYNPTRMTWVKTSFMWMMYRCEWATRDANQARVVAITLPAAAFDEILRNAVDAFHGSAGASSASAAVTADDAAAATTTAAKSTTTKDDDDGGKTQDDDGLKNKANKNSKKNDGCSRADPVRLQWDPDHTEVGGKLERRAIQLGMRGKILQQFHSWILAIDDVTDTLVVPGRPLKFDEALVVPVAADDASAPGAGGAVAAAEVVRKQFRLEPDKSTKCQPKSNNKATTKTKDDDETKGEATCKNSNSKNDGDDDDGDRSKTTNNQGDVAKNNNNNTDATTHTDTAAATDAAAEGKGKEQRKDEGNKKKAPLVVPLEELYVPLDPAVAARISLTVVGAAASSDNVADAAQST